MSWLSELGHWLGDWIRWFFQTHQPPGAAVPTPAAPGPLIVTTLVVSERLIILGKHQDQLIVDSDDVGLVVHMGGKPPVPGHPELDQPSAILRRRPDGEFRIRCSLGPGRDVVYIALTADGIVTGTATDGTGPVSTNVPEVRAVQALVTAPVPAPVPWPKPTPPPGPVAPI